MKSKQTVLVRIKRLTISVFYTRNSRLLFPYELVKAKGYSGYIGGR